MKGNVAARLGGWSARHRTTAIAGWLLLVVAAAVSFFVGERADAVIIGVIVSLSVGLGFLNEYRAEQASEALHSQLRHRSMVRRDARWSSCDITELVRLVRKEIEDEVNRVNAAEDFWKPQVPGGLDSGTLGVGDGI